MAKNGKKSDKKGKRGKRSQLAPAPVRDFPSSAPAALAVAAGALIMAGITSLWLLRR